MRERKQTPDILADLLGGGAQPEAMIEAEMQSEAPLVTITPAKPSKTAAHRPKVQRRPKPKSVMTAPASTPSGLWEHRVASFQEHKGWRLRYEDGGEVKDWSAGLLLPEYIAKMSEDGWQVAGACSGEAMFGVMDKYQVYLKRPVV